MLCAVRHSRSHRNGAETLCLPADIQRIHAVRRLASSPYGRSVMHARKKLLLALAAAGLCAAAAVPFAQSGDVFVPELAAMDGAFCRSPGAAGFPLVRVA